MYGTLIHYDPLQAKGVIEGDNGLRYTVTRFDIDGQAAPEVGCSVLFQADQDADESIARAVEILRGPVQNLPSYIAPEIIDEKVSVATPPDSTAAQRPSWFGYFKLCLTKRYAQFSGRATRTEYWSFVLFYILFHTGIALIIFPLSFGLIDIIGYEGLLVISLLFTLFTFAIMIPALAVSIRRLHDAGFSGWFYLFVFVPFFGGLIIFIFMLIDSEHTDNKYGPLPEGIARHVPMK